MSVDPAPAAPRTFGRAPRPPRLLTWGMSGPRHGIDHAIRAIALLGERRREIRYLVTGAAGTYPPLHDAAERHDQFTRMAWRAGVASSVRVDTAARTPDGVTALVASASVVILCDDASESVHRPTLVATAALGMPMIATASPHTDDVADGAVIVVPYGDAVALAAAIIAVVDDPAALQAMTAHAARAAALNAACGSDARQPSMRELVSAALDPSGL